MKRTGLSLHPPLTGAMARATPCLRLPADHGFVRTGPAIDLTDGADLVQPAGRPKVGRSLARAGRPTPFFRRTSPVKTFLLVLPLVLLAAPAPAQTAADSAAIRQTALDYIDGWYSGDAARMEQALHSHLAKREVLADPQSGRSRLVDLTAMELVQGTRAGYGKLPPAERREEVQILDIFGNAAMVKIDATTWVDYLQQIRWNGRWVIINVVWENRPAAR
jgi:hypothetical protein